MTTSLFGLISSDYKSQVILRWRTPLDESLFGKFVQFGELTSAPEPIADSEEAKPVLIVGPILSDINNPTQVLTVTCVKDSNELYWRVREWSAPSEPPPNEVLSSTQKAMSYSNVLNLLSSALSGNSYVGNYEITVFLPEEGSWQCKLLNRSSIPSELSDLGSAIHNEEIGYRFEGGPSGLEEISIFYDHEESEYVLSIDARDILDVESKDTPMLATPNRLSQLILNRTFERIL